MNIKPSLVVIGKVGSGKSSFVSKLAYKHQYCSISSGDVCRARMALCQKSREEFQEMMSQRKEVPDERMVSWIIEAIQTQKEDYHQGLILEGYPRNENQSRSLPQLFDRISICDVSLVYQPVKVIETCLDDEECLQRIIKGAKMDPNRINRIDNSIEANVNAIKRYNELRDKILKHLNVLGYEFITVDSSMPTDQMIEEAEEKLGLSRNLVH